ncbi:MAG TPA: tRNA guanosine(34) transglycosylase Tgt [Herpetosiphonaceae bacterium]|nr:tRNA guanosine(34) transglycosylase Tgt [Herpetosiphonaceae bacterium]
MPTELFQWTLQHTDRASQARAGVLQTPHGVIMTPVFMPVGTQATVKTLTSAEVAEVGAQIILGNTYHLFLRPGDEILARFGGLHRFMNWHRPILTDSGGFQVWSLSERRTIDEDGVNFRSHLDGSTHRFTPERAMAIQSRIGADIVMAFDECSSYGVTHEYAAAAMERTHRWLERCVRAREREDQALFGIVQGNLYADLRERSAAFVGAQPVQGFGIGGLSVGEPKAEMYSMLSTTTAALPADRPRYLMGVGAPEDLIECIGRGVDMFDCVLPTRLGRHASAFTPEGRINLLNAQWASDAEPIQAGCDCQTCRNYSRAYIRHLFRAGETLGPRLATVHNLRFLIRLMEHARAAILEGRFADFSQEFLAAYRAAPRGDRPARRAVREPQIESSQPYLSIAKG